MTVSLSKTVTIAPTALIPTVFHRDTYASMEETNYKLRNNRLECFPSVLRALNMDTFGIEYRVSLDKKPVKTVQDNHPLVWDNDTNGVDYHMTRELRNNRLDTLQAVLYDMSKGYVTME